MPARVVVTTGCRLHFGLLAHGRRDARNHGGCGTMLAEPDFEVDVALGDVDRIDAPAAYRERIASVLQRFRESKGVGRRPRPRHVTVRKTVPLHVGLGGGTQLAMAVGRALSLLDGAEPLDVARLAQRIGRGRRSAIGLHGFARGGFLVDAGQPTEGAIGEITARLDVPAAWRVVLFTPRGTTGLHGVAERDAFRQLPPTPAAVVRRLTAMLHETLAPSLAAADFDAFSEAVHRYGHAVGETFAPVQAGSAYSHAVGERLVVALQEAGCRGVGQTSWGPTVFAFCREEAAATELAAHFRRDARFADVETRIAAPLNRGASVRCE